MTDGILPTDISIITDIDECYRIDEDLRFLREVEYLKDNHPDEKVRRKYYTVYYIYKNKFPLFFEVFESKGFLPFAINDDYLGHINPFELISQKELSNNPQASISTKGKDQQDLEHYDDELEEALKATLSKLTE